jgi:serine/threonine-protein kinase
MPEQILAGKYVVQSEIAKGGMGVIYKALDRTLNRVVAIKLVHAHLSGDSSFVERFLREARAMARLQHDNIVTIYAVEENQGTQLLVMEYFRGSDLRVLTKNRPRFPIRDIVSIFHQLANALAFAHAHGIIHRDIKPANVMVDARGKAKLTDFGIAAALDEASITSAGQVIGTAEYMSPEQACGTKLDGRSDLYSVGIMLYEMLTGKTPYAESSKTSILGRLAFDQEELPLPFPSDIPSLLQGVVRDLLRRQPDERIPDADSLAAQLHEILHTLPASPAIPTFSASEPTILVSPHSAAHIPDKGEADLPTVLVPLESRVAPSMATERTRISQPTAAPGISIPSHLEETTVLPARPRTSADSVTPPTPAAPVPPRSVPPPVQSSLLVPILTSGVVAVLALTGLVYYLANSSSPDPNTTKIPQPTTRIDPPVSEHTEEKQKTDDERAQREAALQKERERLAQDQLRLEEKRRQAEAQQAKETAERKQLEAQRATSSRERELAAQRAREEARKRQEAERLATERQQTVGQASGAKDVPIAKVLPDQRIQSLLERFRQAYENHDLATIQSISRMSDDRLRNVQVMFANYETIRASIKDLAQTEQAASATLFLDSVSTAGGESISLSPLARKFTLTIPRQGAESEKIIW